MRKFILLSFLTIFFVPSFFCQDETNVRPPFELKLMINDSNFYSADLAKTKYVINDTIIQVFPNEKLFFEIEDSQGGTVKFKVKSRIENEQKTVVIEFKQITEGSIHKNMLMTIINPLNKTLTYKAKICLLKNGKWVSTNVYPVKAKKSSIEIWSDVITTISLSSFTISDLK